MKAARWGKGLTCPVKYGIINSVTYGEMSERFKELVLKTSDPKRAVGSNPTLSASASGHSGGSLAYGCFVEPLESNPESELCRQRFFSL